MTSRRWVGRAAWLVIGVATFTALVLSTDGPPASTPNPPGTFAFGAFGDALETQSANPAFAEFVEHARRSHSGLGLRDDPRGGQRQFHRAVPGENGRGNVSFHIFSPGASCLLIEHRLQLDEVKRFTLHNTWQQALECDEMAHAPELADPRSLQLSHSSAAS